MDTLTEKLNPPLIEGTLPAFYADALSTGLGTATLTVPFALNRAVSRDAIAGLQVRIKTVQSNTVLTEIQCENPEYALEKLSADFILSSDILSKISVGQYLKVQLAFINANNTVGYYSAVGVTKYTTMPTVSIIGLEIGPDNIPSFAYTYTGKYSQKSTATTTKDFTERVYSYKFNLYDNKNHLVQTSGWLLHNSSVATQQEDIDNLYESTDSYTFQSDLSNYLTYYVEYEVTTINGLTTRSPWYPVAQIEGITPDLQAKVVATNNYENGYIELSLIPTGADWTKGLYKICRSTSETNYTLWEELKKTAFFSTIALSTWSFKDFTVEQGKSYKYSLQQYNNVNLYSDRLISNEVVADFEDIFLYDGSKQLKIKYNPKITSFKIDRQEAKMETIGSKYPFIFRNGNIAYHEFPISGLISYLSDNDELFLTNAELGLEEQGEEKRPATFTEYIPVNVNDTADATIQYYIQGNTNDFYPYPFTDFNSWDSLRTLGKLYIKNPRWEERDISVGNVRTTMLTSYNYLAERIFKTAVLEWLTNGEPKLFKSAGEGNYIVRLMNVSFAPEDKVGRMLHTASMTAYEVADNTYSEMIKYNFIDTSNPVEYDYAYETVRFVDEYGYFKHGKVNNYDIYGYALIENMIPHTWVLLNNTERQEIGDTGSFNYSADQEIFPDIYLPSDKNENDEYIYNFQGQLTYRYLTTTTNTFSLINNALIKTEVCSYIFPNTFNLTQLFDNNIKKEIRTFYYLNFTKKSVEDIYVQDGQYFVDENHLIQAGNFLDTAIYVFHEDIEGQDHISYYTGNNTAIPIALGDATPNFTVTVDGKTFLVEDQLNFPKNEYHSILVGNGIKVDCAYQIKTIVYNIELEDSQLLAIQDKDSTEYLRLLAYKVNELKSQIASEG